ncbi:Fic/DOC family protein [Methylocystis iwaonis]|uniref:protein adenylyltransferase n=1 Tax=Methylocystis iwaonis TaxID=2885079 RepID=A0ABM8EES5_9HYPH|nr:Fic family protein [Methylocystis iwaonis]BDV36566.1 putative adenosine monophosphate-protein transferase y4lH [Methylocystis iwaonis]BDV36666.1 putative adenosine monophosphate-protein transferase y4lH [Methylocystis iwaonis]
MRALGYDAFDDPYAYKGINTLKNKLGLRDPDLLEAFELEMTAIRAREPLPRGVYDALHYRRVHRHLFQDVYSWAGKYRTVRTSKGGNPFCFPEHIDAQMKRLFGTLGIVLNSPHADDFAREAARFLGELNAIHPFREGNGRSQLTFIAMIGERAGYPLAFARVKRESFLPAMIRSYEGDLNPLIAELRLLLG